MKKRVLSLLMAVCMVMTMAPAVFAEEEVNEETNYTYEDGTVYKQMGNGEKSALTADELATFSGVHLYGIAGFETKIFPTMQDAYTAINAKLTENGGLEWSGSSNNLGTDDAFNAVYIDRLPEDSEHEGVALTWTIFGTVDIGSDLSEYYLSGGRQDAYYGSDARTIRAITVVGYDSNAQMNISKNPTMPKQWWGDTTDSLLTFTYKNLTLNGNLSNIGVSSNYRVEFDLTVENCKINGYFYHYFDHEGKVIINNCVFDGTDKEKEYACTIQGGSSEALTIQFTNNMVSNYPRGINIEQALAVATISGNTIEADHATRGAIQLTKAASFTVTNNTIKNASGSAFWFYTNYSCTSTTITGNTIESPYLFQVGDSSGSTLTDEVKNGIKFENNDISAVTDPYTSPVKDKPEETTFAHTILTPGNIQDSGNILVSGVTLDKSSLTLYAGDTSILNATVLPNSAPDKSVTWSSSDASVASVDNSGKVTAIAPGTAKITVTTVNGEKTADCTVTVSTYVAPSTGVGGSSTPTYSVTAPKADNGTVTVSPKNARKGAEVTITVKPDAGYEVDEVTVTDKNGKSIKVTEGRNGKYTFTMPASKVEVEVTFVKEYVAPAVSFDDVSKGAWYYDAAIYAAENGIMSGTGGNNFSPDMTTSRAMIWTILARLDGQNVSVTYGNWYDKAQMWAMTNRVSDGTNPNGSITREQLAVMLYSYAQANGYTGKAGVSLSRYLDASETSAWAVEAMEWAVGNGLISSTGGNLLAPTATATRAQVAVILMNFCENLVK